MAARRRRTPPFLLVLFAGWVLSPFVGLVVADRLAQRWSALTRVALYGSMLILAAGSLAIYGSVVLWPPAARPAAIFLMVPLASWLLAGVVLGSAALLARRGSRRGGPRSYSPR